MIDPASDSELKTAMHQYCLEDVLLTQAHLALHEMKYLIVYYVHNKIDSVIDNVVKFKTCEANLRHDVMVATEKLINNEIIGFEVVELRTKH